MYFPLLQIYKLVAPHILKQRPYFEQAAPINRILRWEIKEGCRMVFKLLFYTKKTDQSTEL